MDRYFKKRIPEALPCVCSTWFASIFNPETTIKYTTSVVCRPLSLLPRPESAHVPRELLCSLH